MMSSIDPSSAAWHKSSNGTGGECVEAADAHTDGVPVRDSKKAHGPALVIPAAGWTGFVTALKSGRLTPPAGTRPAPARRT